jgi:DNA-binding MarR family transcriptional regulator
MARTSRPVLDAVTGNVLMMIAVHQDKPCPTNREIAQWTGVPRPRVTALLETLAARGAIELEIRREPPPRRRRLRAPGMPWTGWTQRGRLPAPGSRRTR